MPRGHFLLGAAMVVIAACPAVAAVTLAPGQEFVYAGMATWKQTNPGVPPKLVRGPVTIRAVVTEADPRRGYTVVVMREFRTGYPREAWVNGAAVGGPSGAEVATVRYGPDLRPISPSGAGLGAPIGGMLGLLRAPLPPRAALKAGDSWRDTEMLPVMLPEPVTLSARVSGETKIDGRSCLVVERKRAQDEVRQDFGFTPILLTRFHETAVIDRKNGWVRRHTLQAHVNHSVEGAENALEVSVAVALRESRKLSPDALTARLRQAAMLARAQRLARTSGAGVDLRRSHAQVRTTLAAFRRSYPNSVYAPVTAYLRQTIGVEPPRPRNNPERRAGAPRKGDVPDPYGGARTAHHLFWRVTPDGRRVKTGEAWYQIGRSRGERSDDRERVMVFVDGANWAYQPVEKRVIVWRAEGAATFNGSGWTLAATRRDYADWGWQEQFREEGTDTLNGRVVRRVIEERPGDQGRAVILVDPSTDLPLRRQQQERKGDAWVTVFEMEMRYDEPADERLFTPEVPPDARVFDLRWMMQADYGRVVARARARAVRDEALCTRQLQAIGRALAAYERDRGTTPEYLSDLHPQYLADRRLLHCPADRSPGKPMGNGVPPDPHLPTSYAYVLGAARAGYTGWSFAADPAGKATGREVSEVLQVYFGDRVPTVRCAHHGRRPGIGQMPFELHLTRGGSVVRSEEFWDRDPAALSNVITALERDVAAGWPQFSSRWKPDRLADYFFTLAQEQPRRKQSLATLRDRLRAAATRLEALARAAPETPNSLLAMARGSLYYAGGDLEQATALYEAAWNVPNPHGLLFHMLVQLYTASGRHEKAIAVLEAMLAKNPGAFGWMEQLADAYERAGQLEKAAEWRRRADPAASIAGRPAPDFTLKDLGGKPVRLADLRGKVVFLNFWASW